MASQPVLFAYFYSLAKQFVDALYFFVHQRCWPERPHARTSNIQTGLNYVHSVNTASILVPSQATLLRGILAYQCQSTLISLTGVFRS